MDATYIERDGNLWEKRVKTWLRLRYKGEFEELPAAHCGDFGLEGFSRDGIAYQSYAVREPLRVAELYENQRKKIHDDIEKFINKKDELIKIFGPLKIKQWWLVVPEHKSAKLIQYAESKAQQVRAANLSYVAPDFMIHIAPPEDFAVERNLALRRGIELLRIDAPLSDSNQITEWADQNDCLVVNLDKKLRRAARITDEVKRREYRDGWINLYIDGRNVLSQLQKEHAEIWEFVNQCKKDREKYLRLHYGSQKAPGTIINEEISILRERLKQKLPNLDDSTIEALAHEAVSDWLIRCPLDFVEDANS